MRQGKIWGTTECLEDNPSIEIHHIHAHRNSGCSKHKHLHKFNGFFVISGEMVITTWQESGIVDAVTLTSGQYTVVPPGLFHRFHAVSDCEALEFYWLQKPGEDIIREGTGYRHGLNTGSYMIAVWSLRGLEVRLFRKTKDFPVELFGDAIQALQGNLAEEKDRLTSQPVIMPDNLPDNLEGSDGV